TVRNTYAGMVNHLGLLAADFYDLGFRGQKGGIQTSFGQILGHSFDPSALSDGLGQRYEMMRGYFKPYSGCRYTHAAIDAVLSLQAEETIDVDDLASVDVLTYDIAAHLSDPAPKTPLAGRFSTPYVVAATLIKGSAGPELFVPEMLANPQVLDLAARINVGENSDFTAMTPAQRPAQVVLRFQNGRRRECTVYGSKGDPDQPMSGDELKAKFYGLCEPSLGAERTRRAWEELGRLEQVKDVRGTLEILAPG
ncbi:MAG: MmgE/PrpD family protein, partial [Chloroflexota bacterium]